MSAGLKFHRQFPWLWICGGEEGRAHDPETGFDERHDHGLVDLG